MKNPVEKSDGGLPSSPVPAEALASAGLVADASWRRRLADYAELAKVRLSLLVIFVTAAGFCLGAQGPVDILSLFHVLVGTSLVAFAANALNQVIERDHDRLMSRTADRPLPSGRISPAEATAFGFVLAVVGVALLSTLTNLLAASLAAATFLLYLLAYTPLKRRTPLNTLVGAVPGAIPPLIGFAAAAGTLTATAWILFAILFLWQLPHFFAIAWLYREDYALGGYKMLSVVDPSGKAIARQTVAFTVLLLICSLLPAWLGNVHQAYPLGASLMGGAFLFVAIRFAQDRNRSSARVLLLASIAYLPLLTMLLVITHIAH